MLKHFALAAEIIGFILFMSLLAFVARLPGCQVHQRCEHVTIGGTMEIGTRCAK